MEPWMWGLVVGVATFAVTSPVFGIIFYKVGYKRRQETAELEIGSAEEEAKRIREEGIKQAETQKKEALISAKEDILRLRNEAEKELKERRSEMSRTERRISQCVLSSIAQLSRQNDTLSKSLKKNLIALLNFFGMRR